jgi:hypothetical protein
MTWFYTGGGREKWNFFDFAIGILRLKSIHIVKQFINNCILFDKYSTISLFVIVKDVFLICNLKKTT